MKRQIAAGKFKATCLALLDEVQSGRQEIVITKRGRPVARLLPVDEKAPTLFGRMKGTIKILGDIVGQVFALLVLTVAASEAAIGLAILVAYFRNRGSIQVEDVNLMKG